MRLAELAAQDSLALQPEFGLRQVEDKLVRGGRLHPADPRSADVARFHHCIRSTAQPSEGEA
ncbi:hypothetical protein ACIF8W_03300 [Streptomyces sp. NPDC085639]|uniref:hypothetical protein n=1 Tax=Streptomyces sp. NPDC085639 TaxID=3365734 RepID=UPI0037CEEF0C